MTTATAVSKPTTWQIDPAHTSVEFAVRHLMISTVRGRFGSVSGSLTGLGQAPSLSVTIDAASIDTRVAQRDEHLRSADFFDVANHPTITFTSTRLEGKPTGSFRLIGDLTIRGITRDVALDVEYQGGGKDPWGNERMGFSASGKLDRKAFGLTWNQVLEAGGLTVGDEVKFTIDVELTGQAE